MPFSGILGFLGGAAKSAEQVADQRIASYTAADVAKEKEAAAIRMEQIIDQHRQEAEGRSIKQEGLLNIRNRGQMMEDEIRRRDAARAETKYQQSPEQIAAAVAADNQAFTDSKKSQFEQGIKKQTAGSPVEVAKINAQARLDERELQNKAEDAKAKGENSGLKETEIAHRVTVMANGVGEIFGAQYDATGHLLNPDVLNNKPLYFEAKKEGEQLTRGGMLPHDVVAYLKTKYDKVDSEAKSVIKAEKEAAKAEKEKNSLSTQVKEFLTPSPEGKGIGFIGSAPQAVSKVIAAGVKNVLSPDPKAAIKTTETAASMKEGEVRNLGGRQAVWTNGAFFYIPEGKTKEWVVLEASKKKVEPENNPAPVTPAAKPDYKEMYKDAFPLPPIKPFERISKPVPAAPVSKGRPIEEAFPVPAMAATPPAPPKEEGILSTPLSLQEEKSAAHAKAEEVIASRKAPVETKVPGQLEAGNIDVSKIAPVNNKNGSQSTVKSISVNIDGVEVLIPSVVGGKVVSEEKAIETYLRTGNHLGKFKTEKDATAFAKKLHEKEATRIAPKKKQAPKKEVDEFSEAQKEFKAKAAERKKQEELKGFNEKPKKEKTIATERKDWNTIETLPMPRNVKDMVENEIYSKTDSRGIRRYYEKINGVSVQVH